MDLKQSEITGVILAGGQSRRMGFNKAEAEMHGESMLIRIIDKVKKVTPTIVISSGNLIYPNIQWPQIPDECFKCGPIGGIYSVLKASNTSLNLVVSCDIPLVSVSLLMYIVDKAIGSNSIITVPIDEDGQIQLMCAVYRKGILPILEQQINAHAFKMRDLLNLVSVKYVKISKDHPLYNEHAFMNVNNKNTLEEARKLWKN
ncbi:MAG: molybdenum cofactor guanylyltransferase [Dysgonamonadaceae bacterium]|nr:molybdenum cofactor guanylyltransferase [Dysgonamonadaceae bacterium]MDD4728616.1 molybdenum cofactor guanylyltransferase [Dysgonamonadaceae bacterium]